jgi:hypothetical protein
MDYGATANPMVLVLESSPAHKTLATSKHVHCRPDGSGEQEKILHCMSGDVVD